MPGEYFLLIRNQILQELKRVDVLVYEASDVYFYRYVGFRNGIILGGKHREEKGERGVKT